LSVKNFTNPAHACPTVAVLFYPRFCARKFPPAFFSKYICGHYLLKSFCSPVLLPATDFDHLERFAELEAAKREAEAIRTGPLYRPVRSK